MTQKLKKKSSVPNIKADASKIVLVAWFFM
jgi:hypothetical protein